jgi:hypothetical protein
MNGTRTRVAVRCLQWTVGLVVLLESYRTLHGALSGFHESGHAGSLTVVRLVLSGGEMVAALLFLTPFTTIVGGYALLAIFTLAIGIHGLHGNFAGLEILVLSGVAVLVSLAYRQDGAPDMPTARPR